MRILDDGHIFELDQLGSKDTVELKFIKRSGGRVIHTEEWPGLQVQEVLRALISRSQYLNYLIPCRETEDAIYHLRMALYEYESRAYRRKRSEVNRRDGKHVDEGALSARHDEHIDVPFTWYGIEDLPVGEDGHVVVPEAYVLEKKTRTD